MSNLNPGGSRSRGSRLFTASAIKDACKRNKRRHIEPANGSIANQPHQHSREIARRLRQQARKES
jgi:hypothetical protein